MGSFATRFRYPAARSQFYRRRKSFGSKSAPRRTRTYNPLIKSQQSHGAEPQETERVNDASAVALPFPCPTAPRDTSPDLALVVDAWPTLPEAVRAGIVAMVRAASGPSTPRVSDETAPRKP